MHSILPALAKTFILLVCLSGQFSCSNDLTSKLAPNNRTEYIKGDSIYLFNFLQEDKKIKTDKDKRYFYYVNQSVVSSEGAFRGKVLHGQSRLELRNNVLIEKGSFEFGLKTGEWLTWYENGNLRSVVFYKKGKQRGGYKDYSEDRVLITEGNYSNGLKSGKWTTYDTTGTKLREENWSDNKRNGVFEEFYRNGEIKRKGKYRDGKLHGKITGYDFEGNKEVARFKEGELKERKKSREKEKEEDVKDPNKKKELKFWPFGKKENEETEIRSGRENQQKIKRKEEKPKREKKERNKGKEKEEETAAFDFWPFKKKKELRGNQETGS